jgi:acetyltransferase-like isoleucine patch superfamily enzyme
MSICASLLDARNAFWLRGCERIGHQPQLHGRPSLELEGGCIRIGDRFRLASRPVVSHLAAGPQGVLEIGSDVSIAHGAAIASYELVRIGDGTQIGPYVIIMDTNFHSGSGDQSVAHDCRPVIIGRHCRIGSRVTITRGGSIGDGAEILAGSVVSSAIPPGVCAGGARARVVGRAGDIASRWDSAAAVLPELVMNAFDLETPVELETGPADIAPWDDAGVVRLLAAIENRFGVALDRRIVLSAQSFSELAEAVEHGRCSWPGPRS